MNARKARQRVARENLLWLAILSGRRRSLLIALVSCSTVLPLYAQQLGWQSADIRVDDSLLYFQRWFAPSLKAYPGGLGPGWRHNYEVFLTGTAARRTVHLPGKRHEFTRAPPSSALPERHARRGADALGNSLPSVRVWIESSTRPRKSVPRAAAVARQSGTRLIDNGSDHTWIRADGSVLRFRGSRLVRVQDASGRQVLELKYAQNRLSGVNDQHGNTLRFTYRNDRLERLHGPRGKVLAARYGSDGVLEAFLPHDQAASRYRYKGKHGTPGSLRPAGSCLAPGGGGTGSEPAGSCDVSRHPPPPGFDTPTSTPDTIRLDIRPSSCESFFVDASGIDRGQAIEAALAASDRYAEAVVTVHSFPVADFLLDGELIVVKSRDLTSASYSDPAALYAALLRDGDQITSRLLSPIREHGYLELTENGETTRITVSDIAAPVLELVVQYGSVTPEQRVAVGRAARELDERYGIHLRVVEIP